TAGGPAPRRVPSLVLPGSETDRPGSPRPVPRLRGRGPTGESDQESGAWLRNQFLISMPPNTATPLTNRVLVGFEGSGWKCRVLSQWAPTTPPLCMTINQFSEPTFPPPPKPALPPITASVPPIPACRRSTL